jgi:hypothetical protein
MKLQRLLSVAKRPFVDVRFSAVCTSFPPHTHSGKWFGFQNVIDRVHENPMEIYTIKFIIHGSRSPAESPRGFFDATGVTLEVRTIGDSVKY